MGLITRLIHNLNEEHFYAPQSNTLIAEIKQNIKFLLNTNPNDCVSVLNIGLLSLSQSSIEKGELSKQMGQEISNIINEYEKRVRILSLDYDMTHMPWKLSFMLSCCLSDDSFKEFGLCIDFYNNRYCEVF